MARTCGLRALLFLTLVVLGAPVTQAKKMTECEVVQFLRSKGVSSSDIPIWTCIAFHESAYDTGSPGSFNSDGSHDHGIFQLNDRYWCENSGVGKTCNKNCADFRDDDINDDWACAQTVYNLHQGYDGNGYKAWKVFDWSCSNGRAEAKFARNC